MNEPKYRQHPNFRTALRNEKFYEYLSQEDGRYQFWEWILTILFYTTLHYLKAFLSIKHNLPANKIASHRGIQSELNKLKKQRKLPKNIVTKYEQFKNYSQLARYHYLENYDDFNDAEFVEFVNSSCYQMYAMIRDYILKELSQLEQES